MPWRPIASCCEPGCPHRAIKAGRCAQHQRPERVLPRPQYPKNWQAIRQRFLTEHPYCACGQPAVEVDHIIAISKGGHPSDESNLAGRCKSCHSRKTAREDGGFGNLKAAIR